jgi:hypothetical protein
MTKAVERLDAYESVITIPPTFKFDADFLISMLPSWNRKQPWLLCK